MSLTTSPESIVSSFSIKSVPAKRCELNIYHDPRSLTDSLFVLVCANSASESVHHAGLSDLTVADNNHLEGDLEVVHAAFGRGRSSESPTARPKLTENLTHAVLTLYHVNSKKESSRVFEAITWKASHSQAPLRTALQG